MVVFHNFNQLTLSRLIAQWSCSEHFPVSYAIAIIFKNMSIFASSKALVGGDFETEPFRQGVPFYLMRLLQFRKDGPSYEGCALVYSKLLNCAGINWLKCNSEISFLVLLRFRIFICGVSFMIVL